MLDTLKYGLNFEKCFQTWFKTYVLIYMHGEPNLQIAHVAYISFMAHQFTPCSHMLDSTLHAMVGVLDGPGRAK